MSGTHGEHMAGKMSILVFGCLPPLPVHCPPVPSVLLPLPPSDAARLERFVEAENHRWIPPCTL